MCNLDADARKSGSQPDWLEGDGVMAGGFLFLASRKALLLALVAALSVAMLALASWHLTFRLQTDAARRNLTERASLYEATIRQTIDRFAYLPHVLSRDPRIARLLQDQKDPAAIDETNRLLEDFAATSGANALYILNDTGLTLAASNWNQPLSFVAQNYAFRPYFIDALANGRGRFYAVGVTTGEPGYFLSARVGGADHPLGVVAVKISLEALEREWRAANETVLLADDHGVVFLSSRPDWTYRALLPVPGDVLQRAKETNQYGEADLSRPSILARDAGPRSSDAYGHGPKGGLMPLLIVRRELADHQWTVGVISTYAEIRKQAGLAATVAALAAIVVLLLAVVWVQRRATIRAKLRAHDLLERRVAERTRDLTIVNDRLAGEIDQRRLAEANLRQTQDELIHAGKLAALGHMSAAISHEINQPLAALRTYLSSAAKLVRQSQPDLVLQTISRMEALLIRIADITGHLKRFARSETNHSGVCEIRSAVRNALDLVEARLDSHGVAMSLVQPEAPVFVKGTDSRLEQVLVNLLNNAIDAMQDAPERRIEILIAESGGEVSVEVEDTGCGIPSEHQGLIFAPFFTTKDVGAGLGLGLSISHTIVTSCGGTLKARPGNAGGARFILGLTAAQAEARAPMEAAE